MSVVKVEVSGPAGAGKSAILQIIAIALAREGFTTNHTDLVLRNREDLETAVSNLVSGTTIKLAEK